MSLQEMSAFKGGIAFYAMFKLMEYPAKVEGFLTDYFSEMFNDPWGDWEDIRRAFEAFGTERLQENSSFSKHEDQGDGSMGQFMFNFHNDGVLVQIYEICKKLGILIDADDVEISYKQPPTPKQKENFTKWRSLASMYEKIKDVQLTMTMSALAMGPNINSNVKFNATNGTGRSPAQMKLYTSYLTLGTESTSEEFGGSSDTSVLYKVPWSANNSIHSSMVGGLLGDWYANLITQSTMWGSYSYVDAPLYTLTATDLDPANEYFYIPGCDPNTILNTEYMILLPTDTTADISVELKTCYGLTVGQDLLYPCDVCEYRMELIPGEGRCGSPRTLSPHNIDYDVGNKVSTGGASLALDIGRRVKIRYKTGALTP